MLRKDVFEKLTFFETKKFQYSEFKKTVSETTSISTYTEATKTLYRLTMQSNAVGSKLPLADDFVSDVKELLESSTPDYDSFIKKYGTHYADSVTFGGSAYQVITYTKSVYESLTKDGIDISLGARPITKVEAATYSPNKPIIKFTVVANNIPIKTFINTILLILLYH